VTTMPSGGMSAVDATEKTTQATSTGSQHLQLSIVRSQCSKQAPEGRCCDARVGQWWIRTSSRCRKVGKSATERGDTSTAAWPQATALMPRSSMSAPPIMLCEGAEVTSGVEITNKGMGWAGNPASNKEPAG